MKKTLLSLSLALSLYSQEIVEPSFDNKPFVLDYAYLESLEKGIKRDFYINEYLKADISSQEAYSTLKLIDEIKEELFINFAKKYKDDETLAVAQCLRMDNKDLISSYADCIKVGLTLKEATQLSSVDIELISQKLNNKYPTFVKKLKVISSSIPFTKLIIQKQEIYYDIFFNVSKQFREKYFNYKLPNRTFEKIFKNKLAFNKFLEISIKNPKLNNLNKSLLNIDDSKLNANSSFLLALNAFNFSNNEKAITYLNNALNKTNDEYFKSRILFWKYIVSKDLNILEELYSLNSFNFYFLFAIELLQKEQKDFSSLLKNEEFENLTKEFDLKRKALLFAIIKVQANFNENKVSKDYKIGVSQLNQKTLKSLSVLLNEEYDLQKQFILKESLKYATLHINNLENLSTNPIKTYLAYTSKRKDLKAISNFKSFDINNLKELLILEYLDSSKEIKEFISYLYLYERFLKQKEVKEESSTSKSLQISSFFQTLMKSNQVILEKDLK